MWQKLNKVMVKNVVPNPNSKRFMANNVQANRNTIQIVYGSKDPCESMVDRKQNCFFIGITPWTNTQNNISNQICEKNIGCNLL
jgi:hypothetical protein